MRPPWGVRVLTHSPNPHRQRCALTLTRNLGCPIRAGASTSRQAVLITGETVCVRGGGGSKGHAEIPVPSSQLCHEPKTAFKRKVFKAKAKKVFLQYNLPSYVKAHSLTQYTTQPANARSEALADTGEKPFASWAGSHPAAQRTTRRAPDAQPRAGENALRFQTALGRSLWFASVTCLAIKAINQKTEILQITFSGHKPIQFETKNDKRILRHATTWKWKTYSYID